MMNSNNFSLFDLLLIDIETVPQVSEYGHLTADIRKLFVDKIAKTMPEDFDEEEAYSRRAGILAEFGKAVCISTGYFYKDAEEKTCLRLKSMCNDNEKDLLESFVEAVNRFSKSRPAFQFAGHNIREFDIPFLCRRMIINNVALPPYLNFHGAKPWEIRMTDTLQWWKFGDHKHYTSLDLLANTLGVPTSKDDINGSMVQDVYYKEKDLPRIVKYCQKDVVVVGRLIQRFMNMPLIEDENIFIAA